MHGEAPRSQLATGVMGWPLVGGQLRRILAGQFTIASQLCAKQPPPKKGSPCLRISF